MTAAGCSRSLVIFVEQNSLRSSFFGSFASVAQTSKDRLDLEKYILYEKLLRRGGGFYFVDTVRQAWGRLRVGYYLTTYPLGLRVFPQQTSLFPRFSRDAGTVEFCIR